MGPKNAGGAVGTAGAGGVIIGAGANADPKGSVIVGSGAAAGPKGVGSGAAAPTVGGGTVPPVMRLVGSTPRRLNNPPIGPPTPAPAANEFMSLSIFSGELSSWSVIPNKRASCPSSVEPSVSPPTNPPTPARLLSSLARCPHVTPIPMGTGAPTPRRTRPANANSGSTSRAAYGTAYPRALRRASVSSGPTPCSRISP